MVCSLCRSYWGIILKQDIKRDQEFRYMKYLLCNKQTWNGHLLTFKIHQKKNNTPARNICGAEEEKDFPWNSPGTHQCYTETQCVFHNYCSIQCIKITYICLIYTRSLILELPSFLNSYRTCKVSNLVPCMNGCCKQLKRMQLY